LNYLFSVCEEKITVISTKEYVKEITVTSNQEESEKVITETWRSKSTEQFPTVNVKFIDTVTITDLVIEKPGNVDRYE